MKAALAKWIEDGAQRMGAAIAFYTALSLSPLLIISFSIVSFVYGEDAARGRIGDELQELLGRDGARVAQDILASSKDEASGVFAMIAGLVTLLLGASGVFGELQEALNKIWRVVPQKGLSLFQLVRSRFLSFAMVLGTGFLLLVALVISAAITAVGTYASGYLPVLARYMEILNLLGSLLVVALLFAGIFRVLPDVNIAWKDVWFGAFVTASLFTLGKFLIGLYIGNAGVGSGFGAAGSLIALLVWVYYAAQILLFGAELTYVVAMGRDRKKIISAVGHDIAHDVRAKL